MTDRSDDRPVREMTEHKIFGPHFNAEHEFSVPIFIGPKSDHRLALSVDPYITLRFEFKLLKGFVKVDK